MKDKTIAQLFSNSAGRCSICKTPLFVEDVKIGEMAHIIAKKIDGSRGRVPFNGDLNSYENLILLCPNHHSIVDGNESAYPVERLHSIKADHESWVNTSLANHSKRHIDIAGLQVLMRFIPFTQLRSYVEFLPNTLYLDLFHASSAVEAFPFDNPQCCPFNDNTLENYYSNFVDQLHILMNAISDTIPAKHSFIHIEGREKIMAINPDLTYEEKLALRRSIDQAVTSFLPAYYAFMEYLRNNYSEVDITVFRPNL